MFRNKDLLRICEVAVEVWTGGLDRSLDPGFTLPSAVGATQPPFPAFRRIALLRHRPRPEDARIAGRRAVHTRTVASQRPVTQEASS